MLFGVFVTATGSFTATDSMLTATGFYQFAEFFDGSSSNAVGTQYDEYRGNLWGDPNNDGFSELAEIYGASFTCDTVGCGPENRYSEQVYSPTGNNFIGVVASPVPLPAGGLFLFSGLVGIAARRRMQRPFSALPGKPPRT